MKPALVIEIHSFVLQSIMRSIRNFPVCEHPRQEKGQDVIQQYAEVVLSQQ